MNNSPIIEIRSSLYDALITLPFIPLPRGGAQGSLPSHRVIDGLSLRKEIIMDCTMRKIWRSAPAPMNPARDAANAANVSPITEARISCRVVSLQKRVKEHTTDLSSFS